MAQEVFDISDLNVDARPWVPSFSSPSSSAVSPANEERFSDISYLRQSEKYMRMTRPVPHISEIEGTYHPYYPQKSKSRHFVDTETISTTRPVPATRRQIYSQHTYSPEQSHLPPEILYAIPAQERRQQPVLPVQHKYRHQRRPKNRDDPGVPRLSQYDHPSTQRMEYSLPPASVCNKVETHALPVVSAGRYIPDPADFIRQHYARLM